MFVIVLAMLVVLVVAALVMTHVALPEMRQGHTVFVWHDEQGRPRPAPAGRVASRIRVPLGWSRPQPGPRHAR